MKNSISKLKNKIKNTKYNFSKNLVYHLILPLLAIITSIVLVFTVGFNKGVDFQGASVVNVVVEDSNLHNNDEYKVAKEKVNKVLEANKVEILTYQISDTNYYGDAITVKFENAKYTEEELKDLHEAIKTQLIQEFNIDTIDQDTFVTVESFEGSDLQATIVYAVLGILISLLLVLVYTFVRFGFGNAMLMLAVNIFDILMTIAWSLIIRVRIEAAFVSVVVTVMVISMLYSLLFFTKTKENLSLQKYEKLNNKEIANQSVKDNISKLTLLTFILLLGAFMMGVVPFDSLNSMSSSLFIGVVVCVYSSVMLLPGVWALTHVRKAPTKREKKEDNQVVVEKENSINEIDNQPEVIVETEAKGDMY